MFTSYEIGKENTFLQPFAPVMVFVVVVTIDEAFFSTFVDVDSVVFVKANTFLGARSNGCIIIVAPDTGSTPVTSASTLLDDPFELTGEAEAAELELRVGLEVDLDISVDTNAERKYAGRDSQVSRTDKDSDFWHASSCSIACSLNESHL